MKRFLAWITALVFLSACMIVRSGPVSALDILSRKAVGEVLYHQDFSVLSDAAKSGIVRGTSGSENAQISCDGDTLDMKPFEKERMYVLLPSVKTGDSYTFEFDFAFSDIRSDNGYVEFLLTCRGSEPTNITSLIIRANGTVDDFEKPDAELAEKISAGEEIHVKVPVEKNVLHTIELTAGDASYLLERGSVKVIDDGRMGFGARNANVQIGEIYIVNGVGYAERTGRYAAESHASDVTPAAVETAYIETEKESPATGEKWVPYIAVLAAAGMGFFIRKRGRSRG